MGQVVIEALDTRSISNSGGTLSGTRNFFVHSDDPSVPITEPSAIALGDGTLPAYGDVFPGETELFATTFAIEAIPDSGYTWKVRWNYSSGGGDAIDPGSVIPSVPGYVTFSIEYGGSWRDTWRTEPSLALWSASYADTDIGGRKIDAAGEPVSTWSPLHTLIVEETVTSYSLPSRSILIRNAVGCRNSAVFYGASAGTLLYEGASARRVNLLSYSLSHRFRYDDWLHAAQQPRMNQQRQPDVDLYSGALRANHVRWVQPYGKTYNFSQLSENF